MGLGEIPYWRLSPRATKVAEPVLIPVPTVKVRMGKGFVFVFYPFPLLWLKINTMPNDAYYMKLALEFAKKGLGRVSPNPAVGAILVKEGQIVGKGYHQKAGTPHAEINAIRDADIRAKESTLYVNLEPCTHYGKTPPCVNSIIRAGIKRVVIGMIDPNPLVAGKGVQILQDSGIEVIYGVMENESKKLNEFFCKFIQSKIPFVTLKGAISLDGKVATKTGESRWITSEKSRNLVHKLRNIYDAVIVGVGTVIKDDPLLTTRGIKNSRNPIRIIVDSRLSIPLNSKIVESAKNMNIPTIIYTTSLALSSKIKELSSYGLEVVITEEKDEKVNLSSLLKNLGEREISSLLLEGGPTLNDAFLQEDLIDKVLIFINPSFLGGKDTPSLIGGFGIAKLEQRYQLERVNYRKIGDDLLVEGYIKRRKLCSQAS